MGGYKGQDRLCCQCTKEKKQNLILDHLIEEKENKKFYLTLSELFLKFPNIAINPGG